MTITTAFQTSSRVAIHVKEAGAYHLYIVASPVGDADPARAARTAWGEIGEILAARNMEILQERIFGSLALEDILIAEREKALLASEISPDSPYSYIEGHTPRGEGFAGVIIHAVSVLGLDRTVHTVFENCAPVGRIWKRNNTSTIVLQGIHGRPNTRDLINPPPLQAWGMFERAEKILRRLGSSYHDVVRTWCYISSLLQWYDDFNKVRNALYREFGLMPGRKIERLLLPASTGVSGDNPAGAAAAMDVYAVAGDPESRPVIRQLSNAGQKDAFRYGSAFSRGAVIEEPDTNLIQLSGTAAIDEAGVSLHPGDTSRQAERTLEKIASLLKPEGATVRDFCAATVFVKNPGDDAIFRDIARDHGLDDFPGVCIVSDICREELLFEIDGELAAPKPAPAESPE